MIRLLACVSLVVVMVLTSVGCNTVGGFGRDIERGGEALQNASGTR